MGVVLVAAGLVALISLALGNAGIVGEALGGFVRTLFGQAAWAVPFALGGLGVAMLLGRQAIQIPSLSWGVTLLFLAILGGIARPIGGDFFDPAAISSSGGFVGAIVGWGLSQLLGSAVAVGIGAMGLIGVVLCLNQPLRAFVASLKMPKKLPGTRDRLEAPPRKAVVGMPPKDEDEPAEAKKPKPPPFMREVTTPTLDISTSTPKEGYQLPPISLLNEPAPKPKRSQQEMQQNIETLESTLEEFGIEANVVEIAAGPTVTRYEIQLGPGVRVAKIVSLADNIAMNLAAHHVRVEAPIPGKAAIGVEVPNTNPSAVVLREVLESKEFMDAPSRLHVALGQDVSGANRYADLTKMPHLLIAGATGSGKSVMVNALIASLLLSATPDEVHLILMDLKRVELAAYNGLPAEASVVLGSTIMVPTSAEALPRAKCSSRPLALSSSWPQPWNGSVMLDRMSDRSTC